MPKLKLALENLDVESFDVDTPGLPEDGTVHGRETYMPGSCWPQCSADTLCLAGPCDTMQVRTCGTCHEPHYVTQCGGLSCYEVC